MKKLTAILIAAGVIAGAGVGAPVMAEEGTSFNVALTSNYMWRGLSLSNNSVAPQAGADYTKDKLSLGVWGSSADFGFPNTQGVEVDLYGSYALTDKASIGAIYYYYNFAGATFYEINGGYDFGLAAATLSYSPDLAAGLPNLYVELGGSTEVSKGVNLDWHIGSYSGNSGTSYTDYLIGVSTAFSGIDVSASYVSASVSTPQTNQFVVSAGKTF